MRAALLAILVLASVAIAAPTVAGDEPPDTTSCRPTCLGSTSSSLLPDLGLPGPDPEPCRPAC